MVKAKNFNGVGFNGIPKKIGNSYFILIPKSYIDNNIIPTNKVTTFTILK